MKNTDTKKYRLRVVAASLTAVVIFTVALYAAGGGTPEDPLVTLSYINGAYRTQLLRDIIEEMDDSYMGEFKSALRTEIYNEVSAELDRKYAEETTAVAEAETEAEAEEEKNPVEYEVIRLTIGQKLRGTGACEIILRSGTAIAFVDSDENRAAGVGLSDCTDGGEVLDLNGIPLRHLLIIPRGDGRGLTVTSEDAYIMARGEYEIVS